MANTLTWPGRVATRTLDPTTLIMACAGGAIARGGLSFILATHTGPLPPTPLINVLRLLCTAVPAFAILRSRGSELWVNVVLAGFTYLLAGAAFGAMNAIQWWFIDAGNGDPFAGNLAYYGTVAALIAVMMWSFLRGWAAFLQVTWQTRFWVLPRAWRWSIVLTDRGASFVVVYILVMVGLLPGLREPMGLATVVVLALPSVFELFSRFAKKPNVLMLEVPAGLSISEERRWVCQELGTECSEPAPYQHAVMSAGVLSDQPIVVARVGTADSSQWIACSGRIRWDKKAWSVPVAVLAALRPDISLLLGLPPGWIATSNPADVSYSPEVALTVAEAVSKCRIGEIPNEFSRHPVSVLEPS